MIKLNIKQKSHKYFFTYHLVKIIIFGYMLSQK